MLLVTIDTLRADRLGAYGYAARADAGARSAGRRRRPVRRRDGARAADLSRRTSAILTGRYPGRFGIRLNGMDPLPASAVTIAERLKAAGYRTGAVVGSVILDRSSGLAQGFDEYDDRIAARAARRWRWRICSGRRPR